MLTAPTLDMAQEDRALRERVESWLREENLAYESSPAPNMVFRFLVRFNGVRLAVGELLTKREALALEGQLELKSDQQTLFREQLPPEGQQSFLWEVRLLLAQRERLFRIADNPAAAPWIHIQRLIYPDELTKGRFMRNLLDMVWSFVSVVWHLDRLTGAPRPRAPSPSPYA